jgi:ubiquinone/menaquinone biosynthesis C-methylase UbiE
MQCAEEFPWSNFTGVDSSPIFPQVTDIKKINVTFLQSNVLDKLHFNDSTFDFVHMRCLTLVFTEKEWKDQVLKELVRVCKPEGWVELVELDRLYLNQGPVFKKLCEEGNNIFLMTCFFLFDLRTFYNLLFVLN